MCIRDRNWTSFDKVFLLDDGKKVSIGAPAITGASVEAKVVSHLKGDKVIVFKKKRRKGYRVKNGHSQELTELVIEKIQASGSKAKKAAAPATPKKEVKEVKEVKDKPEKRLSLQSITSTTFKELKPDLHSLMLPFTFGKIFGIYQGIYMLTEVDQRKGYVYDSLSASIHSCHGLPPVSSSIR